MYSIHSARQWHLDLPGHVIKARYHWRHPRWYHFEHPENKALPFAVKNAYMDAGSALVCIISQSYSPSLANQFCCLSTLSDKGKKLINNVKKKKRYLLWASPEGLKAE